MIDEEDGKLRTRSTKPVHRLSALARAARVLHREVERVALAEFVGVRAQILVGEILVRQTLRKSANENFKFSILTNFEKSPISKTP